MNKEINSCGFGNNLGPTNSNFDSFYKNGTANPLEKGIVKFFKINNCLYQSWQTKPKS